MSKEKSPPPTDEPHERLRRIDAGLQDADTRVSLDAATEVFDAIDSFHESKSVTVTEPWARDATRVVSATFALKVSHGDLRILFGNILENLELLPRPVNQAGIEDFLGRCEADGSTVPLTPAERDTFKKAARRGVAVAQLAEDAIKAFFDDERFQRRFSAAIIGSIEEAILQVYKPLTTGMKIDGRTVPMPQTGRALVKRFQKEERKRASANAAPFVPQGRPRADRNNQEILTEYRSRPKTVRAFEMRNWLAKKYGMSSENIATILDRARRDEKKALRIY